MQKSGASFPILFATCISRRARCLLHLTLVAWHRGLITAPPRLTVNRSIPRRPLRFPAGESRRRPRFSRNFSTHERKLVENGKRQLPIRRGANEGCICFVRRETIFADDRDRSSLVFSTRIHQIIRHLFYAVIA